MEPKKKILIVDDEKTVTEALQMKLAPEGYDVVLAPDGREALTLMEKESFDLVLLDIIMPNMDGFDVLAEMKEKKIMTPVIVLSNLGQDEDISRAKALGAVDFLVKVQVPLAGVSERVKAIIGM